MEGTAVADSSAPSGTSTPKLILDDNDVEMGWDNPHFVSMYCGDGDLGSRSPPCEGCVESLTCNRHEIPSVVQLDNVPLDGLRELEINSRDSFRLKLLTFLTTESTEPVEGECNQSDDIDEIQEILQESNPNEKIFALLLSAFRGSLEGVTAALDAGAAVDARDALGRTALHISCLSDNLEVTELLIKRGSTVNIWDAMNKVTPLCCAAVAGALEICRLLVVNGADINAGVEQGISALKYAVTFNRIECVQFLLESKAAVNFTLAWSETPVHVAASEGYVECLKMLLSCGGATNASRGVQEKMTPLHLAACSSAHECVRILIESGCDIHALNSRRKTALHLAASAQSVESVLDLLQHGAVVDAQDDEFRTPLHAAISKRAINLECVRLLLDHRADPNIRDIFGFTPLHYAASNEFSQCVKLLLERGADVTIKNRRGVTPLMCIVRKTPNALNKLKEMFDGGLLLNDEGNDREAVLKMNFRTLVPSSTAAYIDPSGCRETLLFVNLISAGQRWLLMHPLCESFLHFKWLRVRKFFVFNITFYSAFVFLLTLYNLRVFRTDCLKKHIAVENNGTSYCEEYNTLTKRVQFYTSPEVSVWWYLLVIFTAALFIKEFYQILQGLKEYFTSAENWLQWCIVITATMLINLNYSDGYLPMWKFHLAAISMILAWGELMLMIGRFPSLGVYIQMFTIVLKHFAKFFVAYACLIVAFVLSFCILFHNRKPYATPWEGLVSTLVMLTGEYEYNEELFYNQDKKLEFPITAHVIFILFIFIVSIVMMSLLVGLAVSDIHALHKTARLERLVRQTQLIAHIESTLFSKWLNVMPKRFRRIVHNSALVVPEAYAFLFTLRPNDPREKQLPKEILESAYRMAKVKNQRRRRTTVHRDNRSISSTGTERDPPPPATAHDPAGLDWSDMEHIKSLLSCLHELGDSKEMRDTQLEYLERKVERTEDILQGMQRHLEMMQKAMQEVSSIVKRSSVPLTLSPLASPGARALRPDSLCASSCETLPQTSAPNSPVVRRLIRDSARGKSFQMPSQLAPLRQVHKRNKRVRPVSETECDHNMDVHSKPW